MRSFLLMLWLFPDERHCSPGCILHQRQQRTRAPATRRDCCIARRLGRSRSGIGSASPVYPPTPECGSLHGHPRKVPLPKSCIEANSLSYSITSSARASSVGGTSRPSALAVLRLIDQLVLGRRLHRQVGRLLALEDAVDVAGRAPVLVDQIRPVGDQATGGDEVAAGVDRGQPVPGRQRDDQIAMNASPTRSPSRSGRHSPERANAVTARSISRGIAHVDRAQLHPQRRRHGLDGARTARSRRRWPDPEGPPPASRRARSL